MTNKYNVNVTNTFFNPKNDDKKNLVTWISGDGAIKKQIDYIMISGEHKNWVNNVRTKVIANTNQNFHHRILEMDLTMRLKKVTNEHGKKHIDFNLNKLRSNPDLLKCENYIDTEKFKELIRNEENTNKNNITNWDKYQHRNFNKTLWSKTKNILNNVQLEQFPLNSET